MSSTKSKVTYCLFIQSVWGGKPTEINLDQIRIQSNSKKIEKAPILYEHKN